MNLTLKPHSLARIQNGHKWTRDATPEEIKKRIEEREQHFDYWQADTGCPVAGYSSKLPED
ncbi:hypothetical protein N7532_012038 [Penicillium argentinense]|uniref:Uncharacterized protein n=1 Tax=Penicillium argentinense TaxID=1131581 RepID=A0A9W9JVI1_9EURO|nr:uncharacterized protein N7532_012038 [Penicillium argentinense]KAJ5082995.1 hypothetical protein N7532_012038 [Penicillium argentinense]